MGKGVAGCPVRPWPERLVGAANKSGKHDAEARAVIIRLRCLDAS